MLTRPITEGVVMAERNINISVHLTPEELAFDFCNMSDSEQADFFNEVAKITDKWERPFCFQLQWLTDNERLTDDGRRIMRAIGDYSEPNKNEV